MQILATSIKQQNLLCCKTLQVMRPTQEFLFFLVVSVVCAGGYHGEKPGRCPRITTCDCPIGQTQCTRDSDCFYDLKCCSFGCGCRTSCVKPVYEPGPQSGGCFYNGRYYPLGESFPSTDGCNTCFCTGNGQVGCTLIGCPDLCTLPKAPGTCRGYFPRWWYNSFTNQCEVFIYGGCEGNDNRFQTIHECLQRCAKRKY